MNERIHASIPFSFSLAALHGFTNILSRESLLVIKPPRQYVLPLTPGRDFYADGKRFQED